MKKTIFLFALLMALATQNFAQIKSASLTASGLTCSMCSKAIYMALKEVASVKDVQVNIEASRYDILFKDGANVVIDDIKKAVENAGFSVATMQIDLSLKNAELYKDAHLTIGGSNFHFINVPKQQINGDKKLTIIDRNYLPAKEFKKYAKLTQLKCMEDGMAKDCCRKSGVTGRIYHVTF